MTKTWGKVFFLAIFLALSGCMSVTVYPLDAEFGGIREAIESDRTALSRANMLVVHGQGFHCIGYSRTLINNLAIKLGLKEFQPADTGDQAQQGMAAAIKDMDECAKRIKRGTGEDGKGQRSIGAVQKAACDNLWKYGRACEEIRLYAAPGTKTKKTHGYLRVQEFYVDGKKRGNLRVYELTWDPVTRPVKQAYLGFDWADGPSAEKKTGLPEQRPAAAENRAVINDLMKDFFNTRFSDPVLYVGAHKPRIQAVVLQALCHIVGDADLERHDLHLPNAQMDICNLRKIKYGPKNKLDEDVFGFINDNEIIIVSYSLGSTIVFDALNVLGGPRIDGNPCETDSSDSSHLGNRSPDDLLTYQHSAKLGEIIGFFKTCKERRAEKTSQNNEQISPLDIQFAVAAMLSKVTGSTKKIYMLANQLPFLELGALANPVSNAKDGITDERITAAIFFNFRANPFYRLLATISKMKDEEAVKLLSAGPIVSSGTRETKLLEVRRIKEDFKEIKSLRKFFPVDEKHRLSYAFDRFCNSVDIRVANRNADDDPAYFTRRLCATAGEPYEMIEFSDPNDMLSYRFPDRYHAAGREFYIKPFKPVDVELNIAVPWFGIFADPIKAHTGHDSDETVLDFMANGRRLEPDEK